MKIRVLSMFLLIVVLATVGTAAAAAPETRVFKAQLSGPDGVETEAWGHATFNLREGGTELHYSLITHKIDNVFMAHIHLVQGAGAPIVVWLYGTPPAGPDDDLIAGRFDGVLGKGVITADDLVGPLAGMSLEDLLAQMQAGSTFVNVHTLQVPSGEIRGTIYPLAPQ